MSANRTRGFCVIASPFYWLAGALRVYVTESPFLPVRAHYGALRYRYLLFYQLAGTLRRFTLPLSPFLPVHGHITALCVTVISFFTGSWAHYGALRYRYLLFYRFMGTLRRFALPLSPFLPVHGHITALYVTVISLFTGSWAHYGALRYRYLLFYQLAGTLQRFTLPLSPFLPVSGHITALYVTR